MNARPSTVLCPPDAYIVFLAVAQGMSLLADDARLVIYGPFNYGDKFTSASNAQFNETLKGWGAHMAIRDFEAVDALARGIGLRLIEDRGMPANNRCLVWGR